MVDTHALGPTAFQLQVDVARADDGFGQLGGLVAFGQVRIEVVFPFEYGALADFGIDREAEFDGIFECLFVGHGQGAGQRQVDGAGLGVGLSAEGDAGAGE